MVALGGPGTLFGAIIGAGIVVFLKNFVSVYVHRWMMIMSAVFVLTVFFAPDGIIGLIRQISKRSLKK
jgi:branched-chain amino acid transport system permease protein